MRNEVKPSCPCFVRTLFSSCCTLPILLLLMITPPSSQSAFIQYTHAPSTFHHQTKTHNFFVVLNYSSQEDLHSAIYRKEHEMKKLNQQHSQTSDPVRMAMSYIVEDANQPLKLAKALRRIYDDPTNTANPKYKELTPEQKERQEKLLEYGMADAVMRRGCFVVDIKRKSLSRPKNEIFARFDDAGQVATAMVSLGADAVFVNVDYHSYGGDISELKSAVKAVKRTNPNAAVVMKDIVVDEIQLGLAKEAGADGILLIASVLGPALSNFLDLATVIGLETIVECHTRNEVQVAIDSLAQNILVSNYDRLQQRYYPDQAYKLAGMFPGSGGPIICLAAGGLEDTEEMKRLLAVGYDGVVVGRAAMGSTRAPEFIRAVKDRTLLPAEFSQWGLEHVEFDMEGNVMDGPRKNIASENDSNSFM